MKKILTVIGTRPNFIKVTQFRKAAGVYPHLELKIVHTGQHFDGKMADVFFKQFGLTPDYFLNVPPAPPEEQIPEMEKRLKELFSAQKPDLVLVVGDVNSTLAAARAAHERGIKIGHIESGLRSFDDSMPEEYNRRIADELSSFCFVTEPSGLANLRREGKDEKSIFFVGNTMIDTMLAFEKEIETSRILNELRIEKNGFVLMTMHRPATVDEEKGLEKLIDLVEFVSRDLTVVFPIHPRTQKNIDRFGLRQRMNSISRVILSEPLDYFAFQKLIKNSCYIITDSGGIQEESTFAGVPCITLRPNTERPVTVIEGTNELLPFDPGKIKQVISSIKNGSFKKGRIPEYWDGHSSERIFRIIADSV